MKNRKAFGLFEVLCVLLILGLLAVVVFKPQFTDVTDGTDEAGARNREAISLVQSFEEKFGRPQGYDFIVSEAEELNGNVLLSVRFLRKSEDNEVHQVHRYVNMETRKVISPANDEPVYPSGDSPDD